MNLTPRQAEVARLVAKGYSDKAIAREIGISPDTVKAHVRDAAQRVPGSGRARFRLLVLFITTEQSAKPEPA